MEQFDPEIQEYEQYERQRSPLRYVACIAGLVAVGMMIAIPLLQIRTNDNRQRAIPSNDSQPELVARQFSSAMLERRSTALGKQFSVAAIHSQIESLTNILDEQGFDELSIAHALLRTVRCNSFQPDELWCYEAGVALEDGSQLSIMTFSVANVAGSFLVVEVSQIGIPV